MDWIFDIGIWSSLLTLTILAIVLGIDNIIFITLLVGNLPLHKRPFARQLGLLAAMATCIVLLMSVAWLARLMTPLFEMLGHPITGRNLVLFLGGLFLIHKAVMEITAALKGPRKIITLRTWPRTWGW